MIVCRSSHALRRPRCQVSPAKRTTGPDSGNGGHTGPFIAFPNHSPSLLQNKKRRRSPKTTKTRAGLPPLTAARAWRRTRSWSGSSTTTWPPWPGDSKISIWTIRSESGTTSPGACWRQPVHSTDGACHARAEMLFGSLFFIYGAIVSLRSATKMLILVLLFSNLQNDRRWALLSRI